MVWLLVMLLLLVLSMGLTTSHMGVRRHLILKLVMMLVVMVRLVRVSRLLIGVVVVGVIAAEGADDRRIRFGCSGLTPVTIVIGIGTGGRSMILNVPRKHHIHHVA